MPNKHKFKVNDWVVHKDTRQKGKVVVVYEEFVDVKFKTKRNTDLIHYTKVTKW